jgi:glycosyltransferase involved in cell wall biosynthesis
LSARPSTPPFPALLSARGAALRFDPDSPAEIAEAARKLWSDGRLAAELTARGVKRAADFDWARTARRCRALYRALAGRSLSEEDRAFIAETGAELH